MENFIFCAVLIIHMVMALLNVFMNVHLIDVKLELFFSDQDRNVSTASKRIFEFVNHLALLILIVIRSSSA